MEKYGTASQAADDHRWINKATDIHSEYAIFLLSHGKNCYSNAPQFYVIGTLSNLQGI